MTLEEEIVALLKGQRMTVTTAESCTAGLVAGKLMNAAGASAVYSEGYITYSNEAKERILQVSGETLKEYGAVSRQTAAEMAKGAAEAAGADAAVAVTGIAGPGGGSEEKPVGLVYIGCLIKGKIRTEEFRFAGDRAENREQAAEQALCLLKEELLCL